MAALLKVRQKFGKYRIQRRLADGGFAEVYQALDTLEGIQVALKIPYPRHLHSDMLEAFHREIRLAASLDHPNILPVKNAEIIDGKLVVAYRLGETTLAERLQRRLAVSTGLEWSEQLLEALAHAHGRRIIHCDVKPENLLLFPRRRLRLIDFGIARVAQGTVKEGSGSGTLGYIAPEQAMGRPSFRSDVFSAGLVIYRMFSGTLPAWPFEWPLPGQRRLARKLPVEFVAFLRRALQVDHRKRFASAVEMLAAFHRLLPRTLRFVNDHRRQRSSKRKRRRRGAEEPKWKGLRQREYLRRHRKAIPHEASCRRCRGPLAAAMRVCPWCGTERGRHRGKVSCPARCPRCGRGRKLDWRFCPWCYGASFRNVDQRQYTDVRYQGRCANLACRRRQLMPFMRYCPWCHHKVDRKWLVPGVRERCHRCGWGVVKEYWSHCAWCGKSIA
ncbi:MAG: serine/threonine-protein kinase [Acidobacteriota bacterium]